MLTAAAAAAAASRLPLLCLSLFTLVPSCMSRAIKWSPRTCDVTCWLRVPKSQNDSSPFCFTFWTGKSNKDWPSISSLLLFGSYCALLSPRTSRWSKVDLPPTPLGVPLKCPFSNLTPTHPLLCRCISDKHSTALSDRPCEISLPPFFGSANYLFTRPPGQMVAVTRLAFRFLIPWHARQDVSWCGYRCWSSLILVFLLVVCCVLLPLFVFFCFFLTSVLSVFFIVCIKTPSRLSIGTFIEW